MDHMRMYQYEQLINKYAAWRFSEGLSALNLGSADEHLNDERLSDSQRAWLRNFCDEWDKVARPFAYESTGYTIIVDLSGAEWFRLSPESRAGFESQLRLVREMCEGRSDLRVRAYVIEKKSIEVL